jgi:hypothetical protein
VVRDYDPEGDAKRDAQDRADDEELESGSDFEKARAIFHKRYDNTDTFEQAQRKFIRPIDEDRLAKVKMRAEAAQG